MPLEKQVSLGDNFEKVLINVWDLKTKKIVFTGDRTDVANFAGCDKHTLSSYVRYKSRYKKKYCFRLAKQ